MARTKERYIVKIVPRVLQLLLKVYSAVVKEHWAVYKAYKERGTVGLGRKAKETI